MKPETAPLCHECRLRGGTSYYLTERRFVGSGAEVGGGRDGAHTWPPNRNAGHDTPEVEIP